MLKLSLTASGLLDKSRLDAWSRQKQAAIHKAVATGMQSGGKTVADAVRSILDGHIVLSRSIAAQNHYPAIDILNSVSRVMTEVVTKEQRMAAQRLRSLMATHRDAADLINIGAYVMGSNPEIDQAIERIGAIRKFLQQDVYEQTTLSDAVMQLAQLVEGC